MTARKVLNYQSILQVLDEAGCPFCRFMRNFQEPAREVDHLCNFDTWGTGSDPAGSLRCKVLYYSACGAIWRRFRLFLHDRSLLEEEEDIRIREHRAQARCTVAAVSSGSLHGPWNEAQTWRAAGRCRSNQSWKGVDENSSKISRGCIVKSFPTLRSGGLGRAAEFMVLQRGLHA